MIFGVEVNNLPAYLLKLQSYNCTLIWHEWEASPFIYRNRNLKTVKGMVSRRVKKEGRNGRLERWIVFTVTG